jgi:hypothetical protein
MLVRAVALDDDSEGKGVCFTIVRALNASVTSNALAPATKNRVSPRPLFLTFLISTPALYICHFAQSRVCSKPIRPVSSLVAHQ